MTFHHTVLIAVLSLPGSAMALELGDVELPPTASIAIISENVVHNGLNLSMAQYQDAIAVEDTIAWVKQNWDTSSNNTEYPALTTEYGQEVLISRFDGRFNVLLQLNRSEVNGSRGFISILDAWNESDSATTVPGFELLGNTVSQDAITKSDLSLYVSDESVAMAAQRYQDHLYSHEWRLTHNRFHEGVHFSEYQRRQEKLTLLVFADTNSRSQLVVNKLGATKP